MASEIRRVTDDKVVAVGANAVRDGDRYLVAIFLPASGHPLAETDIGSIFELRDTALFYGHTARLKLTGIPDGDLDMAEFREYGMPGEGPLPPSAA